MTKKIIPSTIAILLIILFLYTGLSKILDYKAYIYEMKQSPFLKYLPLWIAWIVPVTELIAAILLSRNTWRLTGFYLSCALLTFFITYLITLTQMNYYIPCGCGGILDTLPLNIHIVLNIMLVLMAIGGIYLDKTKKHSKSHHKDLAQDLPGNALIKR